MVVQKNSQGWYRVTTSIDIAAPSDVVWETLTDWDHLSDWSSTFLSLDGDFSDGGQVTVSFRLMGMTRRFTHTLADFVPGSQFGWSDPFLLGMTDHHVYRVDPSGPNATVFHQNDMVRKGAARLLGRTTANAMDKMYVAFNHELKDEVLRRIASTAEEA